MKENWDFSHCVLLLSCEIALLKEISALQDKARKAVLDREWACFDEKAVELDNLGREFSALEAERAGLFSVLTNDPGCSRDIEQKQFEKPFYAAIMTLPVEERSELSQLYRELKMETLKMRALNETFLVYLEEARALAAAYIEAVCPARGGKLYTCKGRRVSQDLKSIVFNNRF